MKTLLIVIAISLGCLQLKAQETSNKLQLGAHGRGVTLLNNGKFSAGTGGGIHALKGNWFGEITFFRNFTTESTGALAVVAHKITSLPFLKKNVLLVEGVIEGGTVPKLVNKNTEEGYNWSMLGAAGTFMFPLSDNLKIAVPVVAGLVYDGKYGYTVRILPGLAYSF